MRHHFTHLEGEGIFMSRVTSKCSNCDREQKTRYRDFTNQVWSLLIQWGEIQESTVNKPLCETCYEDIRSLLIDRSEEVEQAFQTGVVNISSKEHQPVEITKHTATKKIAKTSKKSKKVPKAS